MTHALMKTHAEWMDADSPGRPLTLAAAEAPVAVKTPDLCDQSHGVSSSIRPHGAVTSDPDTQEVPNTAGVLCV